MSSRRTPLFRKDLCNLCGLCFHLCPVLKLPLEKAKQEIENLIKGKETKYVLNKCNTCFSCNLYCPNEANPYQLILENWNKLYKKRGAPPLYRMVCPTEESNIWQLLNLFLSSKERQWIHNWMLKIPKPDDTILLIGSYTHLFPFIIGGSKLLEYFKPMDLIDHWEGGAYLYQGGYLDLVQKIAYRIKEDFDSWDVKNIIATLDTVEYMFNEVHPKEMGVSHKYNIKNFHNWLLENINSSEIVLSHQLNMKITVHDNCFSKVLGGKYWENPRNILKKCGCKIIEMKHIKKNSLCCGFGAGASWVKNFALPFDIISEGMKKLKEAEETGAQALVSYCSGCIYLLWAARELKRSKIDIFHIIEIVRLSMGEKLNYPKDHIKRAWDIITIITYLLLISIIKKNFYIIRLAYDRELSTFKPKRYRILKIMRYMFKSSLSRYLFSKSFQLLMPIMKKR